jgi:hypothetical protein
MPVKLAAIHANATQTSPGFFEIELPNSGLFRYQTTKEGQQVDLTDFEPGVYTGIEFYYVDAAGEIIRQGYRAEVIWPDGINHGIGIEASPAAIGLRVRMTLTDGSQFTYEIPV